MERASSRLLGLFFLSILLGCQPVVGGLGVVESFELINRRGQAIEFEQGTVQSAEIFFRESQGILALKIKRSFWRSDHFDFRFDYTRRSEEGNTLNSEYSGQPVDLSWSEEVESSTRFVRSTEECTLGTRQACGYEQDPYDPSRRRYRCRDFEIKGSREYEEEIHTRVLLINAELMSPKSENVVGVLNLRQRLGDERVRLYTGSCR